MIPEQTVKDKNGSVPYPRGAILNTAIGMGRLKCRVGLMNGISTNNDILLDRPTTLAFVQLTDE